MECAYTGTAQKCRNAITGTGHMKHQYRSWYVAILVLNQSAKMPISEWAPLNASTSNARDNTDNEPKYTNTNTGTGTIVGYQFR